MQPFSATKVQAARPVGQLISKSLDGEDLESHWTAEARLTDKPPFPPHEIRDAAHHLLDLGLVDSVLPDKRVVRLTADGWVTLGKVSA